MTVESNEPYAVDHALRVASAVGISDFAVTLSRASDLLHRFSVLALAMHLHAKSDGKKPRLTDEIVENLPHHNQQFCELRVSALARTDELDPGTSVDVNTPGPLNYPFIVFFFTDYAFRLAEVLQELEVLLGMVCESMRDEKQ